MNDIPIGRADGGSEAYNPRMNVDPYGFEGPELGGRAEGDVLSDVVGVGSGLVSGVRSGVGRDGGKGVGAPWYWG